MPELNRIFVTTDFSDCATYAVDFAAALARRLEGSLELGHVVDTGYLTYAALYGQSVVIDPDVESREKLEEERARLEGSGLRVAAHLKRGAPVADLREMIESSGCGLVVIGTHGYSGFNKFLFGSTCEKLLREAGVPVLSIRMPEEGATFDPAAFAIDRVACTTDLSDLSRVAFPVAAELCNRLGAALTLVHVVDSRYDSFPYLAAVDQPVHQELKGHAETLLKEWAESLGVAKVETRVFEGMPHDRIEGFVRDHNIDLLIMGTHGHSGIAHALLGSTTERVVRTVACPVLSVKPEN